MREFCSLPIIVQPNAGLPELVGGKSQFPFGAEIMCEKMAPIVAAGAASIGGCCGTTPEHIRLMKEMLAGQKPAQVNSEVGDYICSRRAFVALSDAMGATYEFKPQESTSAYDLMDISFSLADEQSVTLDLSEVSPDKIKELMLEGQDMPGKPLIFKVTDAAQAQSALRHYHGIAAISAPKSADIASIAENYGAYVI
jgi:5-methyltetrahydrofolate--homocysteine methyltransferase